MIYDKKRGRGRPIIYHNSIRHKVWREYRREWYHNKKQKVKQVVVGLPRLMNGSLGEQAEKVKAFTRKLCSHIEVPVEFRDERLTTVSARRLMRTTNTPKNNSKNRQDAVAAALILQGYLDEEN